MAAWPRVVVAAACVLAADAGKLDPTPRPVMGVLPLPTPRPTRRLNTSAPTLTAAPAWAPTPRPTASCAANAFQSHLIQDVVDDARSVVVTDLDGDSDLDLVMGSIGGDGVSWQENDGSQSFTAIEIDSDFSGAASFAVGPIVGAGYDDVIAAARWGASDWKWYENTLNGDGKWKINTAETGTSYNGLFVADVDGDADAGARVDAPLDARRESAVRAPLGRPGGRSPRRASRKRRYGIHAGGRAGCV